jgi:hypothetical protein
MPRQRLVLEVNATQGQAEAYVALYNKKVDKELNKHGGIFSRTRFPTYCLHQTTMGYARDCQNSAVKVYLCMEVIKSICRHKIMADPSAFHVHELYATLRASLRSLARDVHVGVRNKGETRNWAMQSCLQPLQGKDLEFVTSSNGRSGTDNFSGGEAVGEWHTLAQEFQQAVDRPLSAAERAVVHADHSKHLVITAEAELKARAEQVDAAKKKVLEAEAKQKAAEMKLAAAKVECEQACQVCRMQNPDQTMAPPALKRQRATVEVTPLVDTITPVMAPVQTVGTVGTMGPMGAAPPLPPNLPSPLPPPGSAPAMPVSDMHDNYGAGTMSATMQTMSDVGLAPRPPPGQGPHHPGAAVQQWPMWLRCPKGGRHLFMNGVCTQCGKPEVFLDGEDLTCPNCAQSMKAPMETQRLRCVTCKVVIHRDGHLTHS